MSRYLGPRLKPMRALGLDLPGLGRKSFESRPHPPGQHGARKVMQRKSEYGLQLLEKQKLRYHYGLTERQLRRIVAEAKRLKGTTGERIVELLERRLDNLVFRAGFAPSIPAARQLVSHGHIQVNGRRASIPSMRLRVADVFGPAQSGTTLAVVHESLLEPALERASWIAFDEAKLQATLSWLPDGNDVAPFPLDLQRVVEFYAKRI